MVAEKTNEGTMLVRLNNEQLEPWLKEYHLGDLWTRGDMGGTVGKNYKAICIMGI